MRAAALAAGLAVSGCVAAQDLGAAWFIERGRSVPVVFAPVGKLQRPLGLSVDLDVSILVRPFDGVRLGGAVSVVFPVAENAWLTLGVGGLAPEQFEWSSVRPGVVVGFSVRF